jgi:uncharacterized protein YuzE
VPLESEGIEPSDFVFDFDRDGRLVGIEVLAASDLLPAELLEAAERPGRKR